MTNNWRTTQSPETWGTLSNEEWAWSQQFGQSVSWDEYQAKRHLFKKPQDIVPTLKKLLDL